MANPELDAHFEQMRALIASMKAPEVHVHVHTNADVPRKRRRDLSTNAGRTVQDAAEASTSAPPHPYVS